MGPLEHEIPADDLSDVVLGDDNSEAQDDDQLQDGDLEGLALPVPGGEPATPATNESP